MHRNLETPQKNSASSKGSSKRWTLIASIYDFDLSVLATHMEDLFEKEEMDGLTETGDKAKGEEVVEEEAALEEETEVEQAVVEGKTVQAGSK